MEDSYIIANFHALCRLCLNKSTLSVSIFGAAPDDETNVSLTSKISDCFELQIDPNDGLPGNICYKCLFEVDKCSKFKLQCIQNENRLRQITNQAGELDNSNSSEVNNYYNNTKESTRPKPEEYFVGDSVVMVVDPSLDYHSEESDDSDNAEQVEHETEMENIPEGDPMPETFFKNVFMCQYCDQAFVSQEKCKDHEQNYHDANLPYKCVECSLVFAERSQYVHHTKHVHGNDKPYHCPECEKCFGRRSDLRKHSIVHTGIRPYQCQYCFKSFSRNTNLSKHLRIHAGHKPHVCPLCPRSFVARGDLQRHVIVHSGMKPFRCQKCPLSFGRRDKLLKHEMKHGHVSPHHKADEYGNDQDTHDMVVSVNPFSNLMTSPPQLNPDSSNMDYELPRVPDHITGENSFMNQASKNPSTTGKQTQNSPTKLKLGSKNRPKNIKCHQCPKRFSSLDAYKTHVSIAHVGSRGFQCKVCFKKFARKRDLDRHTAIHSGVMKQFSCSQCDKKFTRKDKLDKHEESHESTVVNLPCIECGATFEKKSDLVAHLKSHFTDQYDEKNSVSQIKKEEESDFQVEDSYYDLET
ncbi:zinc finger protein 271 [Amyelois transitella]|uniref:zinc finger protein 271 n=1 Tax=Amyelois transitella TaxID=680683 RepID=UPI00067C186C|nr:zinc finger protein 271 [Amyelois transitella]